MRLALFTFCGLLIVCAVGSGQPGKKDPAPDKGKEKEKEKKEHEITELGGKTVEGWTREFESPDPSKRENAMRMVMSFPINQAKTAVKPLLKELEKHNKPVPIDLSVRISGCLALGSILGNIEKPNKTDIEHVDEAIKLLRSFCKDSQVIVRTRAVQALGRLAGRYSDKVTPTLDEVIRVANDPDTWEARKAGLETLTLLALIKASRQKEPLPSTVWTTFQKRLDDNSMEVRTTALKSLARFSQPPVALSTASLSENALLKHVERIIAKKNEEPSVRIWGSLALMTLQHRVDEQHVRPIAGMLNDPDVNVRIQATQAVGLIGAELQGLRKAKDMDKPKIPAKLSLGLEQFIFKSLVPTLSDDNSTVVTVGMNALAQSDPALAVGPVVDVLRRKDPALKAEAARVLAAIGKHAEPGILDKGNVRKAVFDALQATALNDSDPDIVIVGMTALAHADPLGAVEPVVDILLKRKEPLLRAEAAKVLAGISVTLRSEKKSGRTAAEDPLIATLKDRETVVVVNCINALVQMDSMAAMPMLEHMSVDQAQQEVVRDTAAQAVKLIREHMNPSKKTAPPKGKVTPP